MITLAVPPSISISDEQFTEICQHNRDLRFERTAQGDLIIMAPTGGETGRANVEIAADLVLLRCYTSLNRYRTRNFYLDFASISPASLQVPPWDVASNKPTARTDLFPFIPTTPSAETCGHWLG